MANYSYNEDTAVIKNAAGKLRSIFVSTASSTPTITVYDSSVDSGPASTIIGEFTPVAGTVYNFFDGIYANYGIRVEISGTVKYTVAYE